MEANVVQPSVEVHIIVEGDVVCTVAIFPDPEGVAAVVGVNDPTQRNGLLSALHYARRAVESARFSPLSLFTPSESESSTRPPEGADDDAPF